MSVLEKVISDLKVIYNKTKGFEILPVAILNDKGKFVLGEYKGEVDGIGQFFEKLVLEHNAKEVVFIVDRTATREQGSYFGQVLTLIHYNSNKILDEWSWAVVDYMKDGSFFKPPKYKSEFWDKVIQEEIDEKIDINKISKSDLTESILELYNDYEDEFFVDRPDWLTAEDLILLDSFKSEELEKINEVKGSSDNSKRSLIECVLANMWLERNVEQSVPKDDLLRVLNYHRQYSIAQNPWHVAKYLVGEIIDDSNFTISHDMISKGVVKTLKDKNINYKKYSFLNNYY